MDPITESAPAQPETPDTEAAPVTATQEAVASGDVAGFRAARRAERAGTPLEPAPADPKATTLDTPADATAKTVSRRQQETNDRIREAVTRATADKDAEIARLRAATQPAPRPAATAKAPEARTRPSEDEIGPGLKYDTYGAFAEDLAEWKVEQFWQAKETERITAENTARETAMAAERNRTFKQHWDSYSEKYQAAQKADPERIARIDPRLLSQVPIGQLKAGQAPAFGNHLAEAVVSSEDPVALLEILSDQAEIDRLARSFAVSDAELYRAIGRLESRRPTPAAPESKPVTSAPRPPTTLGSKNAEPASATYAAVVGNDVAAFREARRAERAASMRH